MCCDYEQHQAAAAYHIASNTRLLLGENTRLPVAIVAKKTSLSRTTVQARLERIRAGIPHSTRGYLYLRVTTQARVKAVNGLSGSLDSWLG
ncbi:MAG: hypothetical protein EOS82_24125 [Mesorhizobium sp.]|nr:MAG: hypothetical protein EOS82_24125 [Mesorhizobium sp.]